MSNSRKLGFVGTGLMGLPMALNLIDAGHEVFVWNRTAEKAAPAIEKGARACASPEELAACCDIVLACLTNADAVEVVLFGDKGLASVARPQLFIDLSSMDPERAREMAGRLKQQTGAGWIDAPVSGGTPAAETGELVIMAGGTKADLDRARPVLEPLASRVTHMGGVGAGQMTKLVNQIISGGTMALVAEAVNFAKARGVDASRLTEALAGGFADSKPFQLLAPRMAAENFENPLGTVAMMLKDLDAITNVADGQVPLPMTSMARSILQRAAASGDAESDISTIVHHLGEK